VSGDPLMLSVGAGPLLGMLTEFINTFWEYLTAVLPVDAAGVFLGAADLHARSGALLRVAAAVGDVDAAVSVASWRAGRGDWTRPVFRPAGAAAMLTDIRHPLLDHAVPNSIELQPGRGGLVTGSNMSGKSTFLRTAGVSAVLAQTIHTCLASSYEAPIFRVRSSIGRADDLLSGKSYYIVEVEALLALVRASAEGAPHLFLLDELFRGTNAVERIAAGAAVLRQLLHPQDGPTRHVVLAATHDVELVDLLTAAYDAYHFGDALTDEGLTFDHELRAGRSTSRNAIALLKLHGAPAGLIAQALETAEVLDEQRGVSGQPAV
jgi:DNA mismatch repair ATPase MutS